MLFLKGGLPFFMLNEIFLKQKGGGGGGVEETPKR